MSDQRVLLIISDLQLDLNQETDVEDLLAFPGEKVEELLGREVCKRRARVSERMMEFFSDGEELMEDRSVSSLDPFP